MPAAESKRLKRQSRTISGHVLLLAGGGIEGTFVVELKLPLKMHVEISVDGQKSHAFTMARPSGWMINPFYGKPKTFSAASRRVPNHHR